jgi:hypothetical protein
MRMANLVRGMLVVSLLAGVASAERWSPPPDDVYMVQRGQNTLAVTMIGAPPMTADSLQLFADQNGPSARLLSVKPYVQGDEPMAIVFVMSGQEIWTGNDQFEHDPDIIFPDVLGSVERMIDALDLVHRLPEGSQAAIVTYATGAKVRMPMAPIASLHGSSFGTQRDYYNQIGSDLVSGLQVGMDELERTQVRRKLLVVLGDGTDTNSESAAPQLVELKRRAAEDHIRVAAIVYKTPLSADQNDIRRMVPDAHLVSTIDGIGADLMSVVHDATQIFYATFDISALAVWDGRAHDLALWIDGIAQDPVTLSFQDRRSHGAAWWKSWWAQLVFGFAGLGVLVALARRSVR